MSDPLYRRSSATQIITIAVPVNTTTTIQAFGSADGYATPDTLFGTDETIMVGGTVVATDGANLSVSSVLIRLDGPVVGSAGLSFDPATGINYYQFTLGTLSEGDHTVEAVFQRVRI